MCKIKNVKEEIVISSLDFEKTMSINGNEIDFKEKGLITNELVPLEVKTEEFDLLMEIYKKASEQVLEMLNGVKIEYNKFFNHNIINHTVSRIKEPQSILNKMKKKNLEPNYRNLVDNINDIAGVRVICPVKDDVYTVVSILEKVPNWNLIIEKDYIKNPKKSGYSGYHVIVEVPVKISNENNYLRNQIFVKVEIQIRTMAMDFWATNEHKMKYKTNKKLSILDSARLKFYAKVLDAIDYRFNKINQRTKVLNSNL